MKPSKPETAERVGHRRRTEATRLLQGRRLHGAGDDLPEAEERVQAEEGVQEPFLTRRSSSKTCQDHGERRKVTSSTTP